MKSVFLFRHSLQPTYKVEKKYPLPQMLSLRLTKHSYKGFVIMPHISIDANSKENIMCRKEAID